VRNLNKPRKSYTKLIHLLGSGSKISVEQAIENKIQKNMIFRTYRPDYDKLSIYENEFTRMKRKIQENYFLEKTG